MLDPNKAVEQMQSEFSAGFQAGAASRDAEVARLKTVPMRYRRMAFNAQLQDEVARLEQENDQLRAQIKQKDAEIADLLEANRIACEDLVEQQNLRVKYAGQIEELVAALKPFGAIDLVESRLPAEFAMLILRARAASRDAEVAKWKAIAANKADQVDAAKEVIAEVKEERNQLRAHINMLREALSSAENALDESRDYPVTYDEVITALITTPEQSLAEYRNKVIEECAAKCKDKHVNGNWMYDHREECEAAILDMKEQP